MAAKTIKVLSVRNDHNSAENAHFQVKIRFSFANQVYESLSIDGTFLVNLKNGTTSGGGWS